MSICIMQGDTAQLYLKLTRNKNPITQAMVSEIEVSVGDNIRKKFTKNEVLYDGNLLKWRFILTQEETLAMSGQKHYKVIARVKFSDTNQVAGEIVGEIFVRPAPSKEVL